MISYESTFRKVVRALDEAKIPHMLVGSFASTSYGPPRATYDIDFVIDPTHESLDAFAARFDPNEVYVEPGYHEALDRRDMFNIVDVSTGWKVDLMILKDSPFDRSQFARRRQDTIADIPVWVATPEDTVLAKLRWAKIGGSDRQVSDAGGVLAALGDTIDHGYINRWADELHLRDLLDRAHGA